MDQDRLAGQRRGFSRKSGYELIIENLRISARVVHQANIGNYARGKAEKGDAIARSAT